MKGLRLQGIGSAWGITPRVILVAAVFGGVSLLTIVSGLHFRVPGTGTITDPREIFVILGAALTGPLAGMLTGLLASLADPGSSIRFHVIATHIIGCVWVGYAYRRVVYPRRTIAGFLAAWNGVVFIYYFLCSLPVLVVERVAFPAFFQTIVSGGGPFLAAVLHLYEGWVMEYLLTAVTTSVVLLILPAGYRHPLWVNVRKGTGGRTPVQRSFRRTLGIRLTAWFLLTSLLPLAILALFVRGHFRSLVLDERAAGEMQLVRVVARVLAEGDGTDPARSLSSIASSAGGSWAVLDTTDGLIAGFAIPPGDHSPLRDLSPESRSVLAAGGDGYTIDERDGMMLVYARVPGRPWRVVLAREMDATYRALRAFGEASMLRVAASLLTMSVIAGIAIWLIVGAPMRRLATAVERFGKGDRTVRVDTGQMSDETAVLGRAFNEMAENIGILHGGLEQEIRDRRSMEQALRESERKFHEMAEFLPQPVFETDLNGRITFANRAAFHAFRLADAMPLAGLNILDRVTDEDRPRAGENFSRLTRGESFHGAEYVMVRFDGSAFPALVHTGLVVADDVAVGVRGVVTDISGQKEAAAVLRKALAEKEVLLREVHHRVKNNLQVISSLLSLQADAIVDVRDRALFRESEDRVRSMALIHERLYKSSDVAWVDFQQYLESLVTSLFASYRRPGITYALEVDDCRMPLDVAIPCGLIVNELVTNALKHAYPDGTAGVVQVSLRTTDGHAHEMCVADDGAGLPAEIEPATTRSLGLSLVGILTHQIQGRLVIERGAGTAFRIHFTCAPPPHAAAGPAPVAAMKGT